MRISLNFKICLLGAIFLVFLASAECFAVIPLVEIGKVVNVYAREKTIVLALEVNTQLPFNLTVYISKSIPAIVGDKFNEEGGLYYYEARVPIVGKIQKGIEKGEIVYAVGEKKGVEVYLKLEKKAKVFKPKKQGQVIAAYEKDVQIDRGSLHKVRERDIYAVCNPEGKLKGAMEISAIGDRESLGELYQKKGPKIEPGDQVIYLGQRKYYGAGNFYGKSLPPSEKEKEEGMEKALQLSGLTTVLSWVFRGGWGIHLAFPNYIGEYRYSSYQDVKVTTYPDESRLTQNFCLVKNLTVNIWAPLWVKKNFFYPSWFSPYLGAGLAYFTGNFRHHYWVNYSSSSPLGTSSFWSETLTDDEGEEAGLTFFPAIGIELFPSYQFHIFFDAKYIYTPWIRGKNEKHNYQGWLFSIGYTQNW